MRLLKFLRKRLHSDRQELTLYERLTSEPLTNGRYKMVDRGDNMSLISQYVYEQGLYGEWLPRYVLDHSAKTAFEFMNEGHFVRIVSEADFEWSTLSGVPEHCISRQSFRCVHYPISIQYFHNGVAEVVWQRTRDAEGFDYVDEDGFGVGSNFELTIYGYIDKQGNVVGKFRRLRENESRAYFRRLAEANVSAR